MAKNQAGRKCSGGPSERIDLKKNDIETITSET